MPPFAGGAVGYAGYDVVRYAEDLPNAPFDDRQLPDLSFAFYDRTVVFDNINKTMIVLAMARIDGPDSDLEQAYRDAQQRVDSIVDQLSTPRGGLAPVDIVEGDGLPTPPPASNFQPSEFEAAVRRCVDYIRAGDIFQVVISQRLQMPIRSPSLEIYRTLRVVNPSPFMFFLRKGVGRMRPS